MRTQFFRYLLLATVHRTLFNAFRCLPSINIYPSQLQAVRKMSNSTNKRRSIGNDDDESNKKPSSRIYTPVNSTLNIKRVRLCTNNYEITTTGSSSSNDCVVYWMSRDQRINDNDALNYAQAIAADKNIPLKIIFNLVPKFLDATLRQYDFMLTGLKEVERQARSLNIPFYVLFGDPIQNIPNFLTKHSACVIITDFQCLRVPRMWQTKVAAILDNNTDFASSSSNRSVPMFIVDAHNLVPCWIASDKLEYGARTIRPKISAKIPEFLTDFPAVAANPQAGVMSDCPLTDWNLLNSQLEINRSVLPVDWIAPGYAAGMARFEQFLETGLKHFGEKRNDPNEDVASNLSPYFHCTYN